MTELKERAFALLNTWTTCDTSLVAADLAPGFIEYDRPQPTAEGVAGLNEKLGLFHKAHKDVTIKVLKQIASDNVVCTEWLLISSVRSPDGEGGNVGKPILQPGISWTYFANGKIIKNRIYRDMVGYMMQRGYRWSTPASAVPANKEKQP
jgi:hypothetical protein